ncbi:gamma-glutamylcyclotransferase [Mesorhizobium sp. M4B.F.Ca.ET.215.01.1.1]|uniref:gamma-glutamylcyclotransferase n=2 Tax=Mesorhizobium TaxID=68287 RepID=UPI000FC9D9C4|nr:MULTISPECIES: gamma-glutamylcyclotransferase [unclassified Mesorhizobium]RUW23736.1 gamma-glutamylcyclotransferase [Mesorhizobium sp. M4B.F.Ca.ET.013.02.1.1]RVD35646.1 gamma-glutamylcyclotransferase [Mesorhizobium sp. M4B.F.Ca.ET.019.03.1.1]RWF64439.1 MAG: gamma-glutamylcyclotransferase [Mesorhizobium sp.]TGQ11267.1 gamma-glutamylcyclotransferase [Mesorhizobium sp. M4B.F.Ca.ET.215.01.1.1]TGQ39035.1 gamma-glutamylcyclotransferase [Mesorhizobium sp. M4B.F.Ca.ET.214.01.1.1]
MPPRTMSLTEELVARCFRVVEDSGPDPNAMHLDDADYEAMLDTLEAELPGSEPLWLFGYGSLIWKPEIDHVEERVAVARGWHRSFCMKMTRWRGTREQPGLMMALDRGGQCKGVAFRLGDADRRRQLDKVLRREVTLKPTSYHPRLLNLSSDGGTLRALAFVINRKGTTYSGPLEESVVVERLATSCGHWGSGADYLYNTVKNLEQRGIHDRHLWRLQHLVAERIAASDS